MQQRKVEIVPYEGSWPTAFAQEAEVLKVLLGEQIAAIHHIGSTAIPGMPAKPVIDIIIECKDLHEIQAIAAALKQLQYANLNPNVIPHTSFITFKEAAGLRYHLHLFEVGDPQTRRHINFRDYLRAHPQAALEYRELKLALAAQYHDDIYQYVKNKSAFVFAIDAKAKSWSGSTNTYLPQFTGQFAADWQAKQIIQAIEANWNVAMTHFAQYIPQIELIRIPAYTLVNTGLADVTLNFVMRANFTETDASQKIAEVSAYFQERKIPFTWWQSPSDFPISLAESVDKKVLYCNLDTWLDEVSIPASVTFKRALDQQSLQDFASILTNNPAATSTYYNWVAEVISADDPVEFYVGYIAGMPVVRGLICYYAGVAGFYQQATAPKQCSHGYGKAMQLFCLQAAKERGYHLAAVLATQESFSLYAQLGFQECAIFRLHYPTLAWKV